MQETNNDSDNACRPCQGPRLTYGMPMKPRSKFDHAREELHARMCREDLLIDSDQPTSNADINTSASKKIALGLAKKLEASSASRVSGQTPDDSFVHACVDFIITTFGDLIHLRPGKWTVASTSEREMDITGFEQYSHLHHIRRLSEEYPQLRTTLGDNLYVKPDIVVFRAPRDDEETNRHSFLVRNSDSPLASLLKSCTALPILHASIACSWTIRSGGADNFRSQAFNLLRYRKGHSPHLMVITAEPNPERLAAMCLGTGEIDYFYHFALPELSEAIGEIRYSPHKDLLEKLIEGNRLRDISDLPLDLAI